MSWSQAFKAALGSPVLRPYWVLEGWGSVANAGAEPERRWAAASQPVRGSLAAGLIPTESGYTGQALTIRSWSTQHGTISVGLAGSASYIAASGVHRGQLLTLSIGFPGVPPERVWIGVLQNIHDRGGWAVIEGRDFGAWLQQRRTDKTDPALFSSVTASTTVATPARAAGGATLTVASTAGFQRATGGSGALRLTIGTNTHYLTYTGTTATEFTGCVYQARPVDADLTASVDENANVGDAVEEIAWLEEHPIDIARQILTSTGAGTNGSYDVLPSTWGFALPQRWIDGPDCDLWRTATSPSGSADLEIMADGPATDGAAWLQALLSLGGWYITQREGRITVRGVISPLSEAPGSRAIEILDEHIVEVGSGEWWDGEASPEYAAMSVISGTGTGGAVTGDITDLPAAPLYQIDGSDPLVGIHVNEANWRTALRDRLYPWYLRVPERRELTLLGWRWATLTIGDIVRLESRILTGRGEEARHGYRQRRALVLAVEPQWFAAPVTRVTLAIIPDLE